MFFYQLLPFQSGFFRIFHMDRWLINFKIISKLCYSLNNYLVFFPSIPFLQFQLKHVGDRWIPEALS